MTVAWHPRYRFETARPPGRPPKLSPEQIEQVKREYREGGHGTGAARLTMKALAAKYRVSLRLIKQVLHAGEPEGTSYVMKGERHTFARLTEQQVLAIRRRVGERDRRKQQHPTYEELAGQYHVTAEHIERIVRRERWTHI